MMMMLVFFLVPDAQTTGVLLVVDLHELDVVFVRDVVHRLQLGDGLLAGLAGLGEPGHSHEVIVLGQLLQLSVIHLLYSGLAPHPAGQEEEEDV